MAEKEESKYLVLKLEDIDNFLSHYENFELGEILISIREARSSIGKGTNSYIVCNQDEPYAEEVWQTILKGEDNKNG